MIFERLANGIMKHSKLIIAVWIVLLICAVPFAAKAADVLSYNTDDMAGSDSESVKGMAIISENFYTSDTDVSSSTLLVITYEDSDAETAAEQLITDLNNGLSTYVDDDGNPKIAAITTVSNFEQDDSDGGMILVMITYVNNTFSNVSDDTNNLRNWISEENTYGEAFTVYVTGSPAITYDMEAGAMEDISHIDIFSILLILILVGLFFRSIFASTMPPITIGVAIGITFCALYFIGSAMEIFFITEMFIIVSMLGAGCDYCIFIISRYREERRKGHDHDHAMRESIIWAGESITTSGISVMIGFGAMSICSFSMISGMGIMLAVGIAIALLAALTLITSILNLIGEKIFWPSKIESFQEGSKSMNGWYGKCAHFGDKYFHKSVKFSLKHAKAIVIAAVLITVPSAYVMATAPSSYDMIGTMLTGDSGNGLNTIEDYANGGMIMPDYEVMELEDTIGTVTIINIEGSELGIGYVQWNSAAMSSGDKVGYIDAFASLTSDIYASDSNVGDVTTMYSWQELEYKAIQIIGEKGTLSDIVYLQNILGTIYANGWMSATAMSYAEIALTEFIANEALIQILVPGFSVAYDNAYFVAMMDYATNYLTGTIGGEITSTSTTEGITTTVRNIDFACLTIVTKEQAMSDNSMDTLDTVKNLVSQFIEENPDMIANVWLTGSAAVMFEISETVYSEFIKVIALAVLLIFCLLFVVMRSYLTPLRSILTILMSVVWTIAITHLLFSNVLGYGVIWLIPIVLIVICLGLGMDYDILLTTRIKENYMHNGMTNDEAIKEAVVNSGSVITICGLIMGGAFGTLMMSSMPLLQEFGFALCFAIIVDALIIRTYIVPAVMHLMGDWCWKGPKFMQSKTTETESSEEKQ